MEFTSRAGYYLANTIIKAVTENDRLRSEVGKDLAMAIHNNNLTAFCKALTGTNQDYFVNLAQKLAVNEQKESEETLKKGFAAFLSLPSGEVKKHILAFAYESDTADSYEIIKTQMSICEWVDNWLGDADLCPAKDTLCFDISIIDEDGVELLYYDSESDFAFESIMKLFVNKLNPNKKED